MTAYELIDFFNRHAIRLETDGDKLRCRTPPGFMTAELRALMQQHKAQIIALLRGEDEGEGGERIPRRAAAYAASAPLSFAQQRLWFLDQFEPGGAAYNIAVAVRLMGVLDRGALEAALGEVVARHESLRTRFGTDARGEACQLFDVQPELVLVPREVAGEELADRVREEAEAPFDLAQGPLVRARLLACAPDDHVLLLTVHHIVADGWSMGVLVREVSALYAARVEGRASPLPPLPVQYADYACWQREWLQGDVLQKQLDYWTQKLAGSPGLLTLPSDRPRPLVQRHRGARHGWQIGAGLAGQLRTFGRERQATLFMVLAAGFAALLSRYAGQEEVNLGTAVANRSRSQTEGLIGFFVNTLVLRIGLQRKDSFETLLDRVRQTAIEAYAHQDVPFERLVEALKPERHSGHGPLFQAMLVLQNAPAAQARLPGLQLEEVSVDNGTSKFDLMLNVVEGGEDAGLNATLEYDSDLFDARSIEQLARHFERLLQEMVAAPKARVMALPLLSQDERERVLVEWNAGSTPSAGSTIAQMFEQQAARTPEAVAAVFEDRQLSYGELEARANQLAHALRAQGVGPEVLVGLCVERGLEMIVAVLGILKAGGAYLPLDPNYPVDRLRGVLDEARPRLVITQSGLQDRVPGATLLCLDTQAPDLAIQPTHAPASRAQPENLAYVIYTSGSTGRPKGVGIRHGSASAFLAWVHEAFEARWLRHVLASTSLNFDLSVFELFAPLSCGGTVWVVPDVLALLRPDTAISRAPLTLINTVPSAIAQLERSAAIPSTVQVINVAGEALALQLVQQLYRGTGVERIFNLYGPTEDTTYSTCAPLARGIEGPVPIGRPIAGTQVYLLDEDFEPVPPGVAGELYVGGAGLARGYLNRPDLTAERFIPDPFGGEPGARLYRTGDLARHLPDGTLDYLGRVDHQVKLRGFRIELGEIEAVLAEQPELREAVVLAREDTAGDKRLAAYVVARPGHAPTASGLRAALAQRLPEYMVPAHIVLLDALPLTPNGKVDRKALPAPDGSALAASPYEAPVGPREETMAAVWASLLGVERVSRHDNFFALGGHSLLAIGLVERLRQQGIHTDARSVFAAATLAQLAARVDAQAPSVPAPAIPEGSETITPEMLPLVDLDQPEIDAIVASVPGGVANVQDIYPLGPLQEGILFHHLLQTRGDAYILRAVLGFDSEERRTRFLEALQQVIDRHDILRSAVRWQGLSRPVQVVHRQAPLQVREVAGEGLAQLLAQTDPRQLRLDLTRAPLIGAFTAHSATDDEPWLLALLNHHMVTDHLSVERVVGEVQALLNGRGDALVKPQPYREFIAQALSVPPAEHARHFREVLGDVDTPTAAFGVLDVRGEGASVHQARVELDAALSLRLRRIARTFGVSPAALFHLAWAQVLGLCSGRRDVVFGTVLLGRSQGTAGADQALGMFINTLPVRVRLDGGSVEQALRRTQASLRDLLRHEQASLALAQRASGVDPALPLFTALLNYRHTAPSDAAPWQGMRLLKSEERTNYPLSVDVDDRGEEGFSLIAACVREIDPQRIAGYLDAALSQLADALEHEPSRAMSAMPVPLPADELQRLARWNDTTRAYPAHSLHRCIEAQVARTPDAVALRFEDEQLSYAALNRRANQLARHLRSQGVGPDTLVGLCAERSLEMVVGLMAILKAGGAYVPLDPAYPADRLAFMLDDARPALVVGHAELLATLPLAERGIPSFALDRDGPAIAHQSTDNLPDPIAPDHLAYVIYTSGSTGSPKGVLNTHRNVVHYADSHIRTCDLVAADRVSQLASISFDLSVEEIFPTLVAGACVVLRPRAVLGAGQAFSAWLARHAISIVDMTTAYWNEWTRSLESGEARLPDSVRLVIVGGEKVQLEAYRNWSRLPKPRAVQWLNLYGPTETTIGSTLFRAPAQLDADETDLSIGRPIDNTRIHLLDARLAPVPIGVAGELCIAGVALARGYLNRPDLTARNFVPDPFATDGSRMYRTGDLARFRADGQLEYMGRLDNQVKIRGYRIELGEIEAVLARSPAVREAVVLAREDQPGNRQLVAYVVPESGNADAFDLAGLRAHLLRHLPEYMVPVHFVQLAALPQTPSRKIDHKALPAPVPRGGSDEADAPRTPLEQKIAALWIDLLGCERVGAHDNFFALGGHSLLVTRLMARLREAFGIDLPLRALFEAPMLSSQALRVEEALRELGPRRPPIVPVPREGSMALSFAQSRFWFLQQFQPDSASYAMPLALNLEGRVEAEVLLRAFDAMVARHEPLRTVFVLEQGRPRQKILPALQLQMPRVDLRGLPSGEAEAATRREIEAESARPFRLDAAPLLRIRLLQRADNEFVLLLTLHHILYDGWSQEVLLQEVSALYAAFLAGAPSPLPPMPIQYADYSHWEQQRLDGEFLARELAHWRVLLQDIPELLALPLDRPRPATQTFHGAEHASALPAALTHALEALAGQHDTTLFMLMKAALDAMLYRWTGQGEFCVGALSANRPPQTETLIGIFVNVLALPARVRGEERFCDLLKRTAETIVSAHEHALPFELLLTHLAKSRDASYTPYAQVAINFHNAAAPAQGPAIELPDGQGLRITGANTHAVTHAHFELKLEMEVVQGRLRLHYEYNTDLFERVEIERLADGFERLLAAVVEAPEVRVSEIALLGEALHALLRQWNDTARPVSDELLHEAFERQAASHPARIAVIADDCSMSYGELHALARTLGAQLVARGVAPDTLVALALPKGWEQVVAALGVLYAGAAYLPLDPSMPVQRLHRLLRDSEARVVLTRAALLREIDWPSDIDCIAIDRLAVDEAAARAPWQRRCGNEDLAYVIYTSGSTGEPKGVMIDHRGALNTVLDIDRRFGLGPEDRVFALSELNFDLSVFDLFGTLAAGGAIVMPGAEAQRDPAQWVASMRQAGVTVWNSVPALLGMLVEHVAGRTGLLPPSLRLVMLSGDWIPLNLPERVRALLPQVEFVSLGGATEASIWSNFFEVGEVAPAWRSIPYGRPLDNQSFHILDELLQPCPIGTPGQLHIGGIGLARGYWRDAEKTARSFIVHPRTGERLYRTGDFGRYRADGQIEFLGRRDAQVKVQGYRIELGEIESALSAHPSVRAAAVHVVGPTLGEKRLIACVVPRDGTVLSGGDLNGQLLRTLPPYMVPAQYVMLDALPLTANGKVDRQALPVPQIDEAQRYHEAPEGPTETAMAAVWASLLGVERVGRHDNFFALGGHSLLAIGMVERLRQQGIHTDARSVFGAATLAQLAARVDAQGPALVAPAPAIPEGSATITPQMLPLAALSQSEIDAIVASVPGGVANVQDIYPLGPLQEGILFHHLLQTQGDAYILRAVLGFDSEERRTRFLEALQQVIDRHDILRSAVRWQGLSRPVQVVHRQAPLQVQEVAGEGLALLLAQTDPRQVRLDLTRAPLIGAFTAHAGEGDEPWLLALLNHHMVTDDLSSGLVVAEVQALLEGQGAHLPEPQPYREFVAQALSVPSGEHESYFREELGDVDAPTAAFGVLDVRGEGAGVHQARLALDVMLARRLRQAARAFGVSPAVLFHLAWALVLGLCSGRRDVVFGTVLLGRSQGTAGADRALGMFINTLPVRVRLDGGSIEQSLRRMQTSLSDLLRHEQASLALAQRASGVDPALPLFTALLNYRHSAPSDAVPWQGMRLIESEERTNYPLVMDVEDRGEGFHFTATCVEEIDAERIVGYLADALIQLVDEPARPVGAMVLPEGERRLLGQWNDTTRTLPTQSLHRCFEAQVVRAPDAVALRFEGESLSYAVLNQRANQLAHHLRSQGVAPDTLVGLCANRSLEMVVGLMAILKAGGAYLPLDPAYPSERLAFMLDDARPALVVGHAELLAALPLSERGIPSFALDRETCAHQPLDNLPQDIEADHLAYVIYTSGSTGTPKAVMVTHGGWRNLLQAGLDQKLVGPSDRVLQFASPSFDASAWEIGMALSSGACLCLLPLEDLLPGGNLERSLRQCEISVALLPTAVLHALQPTPLPALHTLLVGGEACAQAAVDRWAPGRRFFNAYGPTEATVYATLHACTPDQPHAPPIGRPIANLRIHVLDAAMQPVPPGVPGELYIGGDGLARGYLHRPDLTAERFVPDPFATVPGERLYRSGDLARHRADGVLEYLGRCDRQLKIRGFRVEPGEIEAGLRALPGVADAAVVPREDLAIAFVTPRADAVLDPAALRSALAQHLPAHMLPARIAVLDRLPLTASGKLDQRALAAHEHLPAATGTRAPRTPTEIALAAAWSEVLGLASVGIDDDFFVLGGDSLRAVRVSARAAQRGLRMPVATLLAFPTVAALARELDRKHGARNGIVRFGQSEGAARPALFLIHGAGNQITGFDRLAAELDAAFEVFAIQSDPFDAQAEGARSLAALADCHAAWIEGCRAGPYALAGWSMGGLLALMVARRLEARGHAVRWVGLIDTWPPTPDSSIEAVTDAAAWGVLQGLAVRSAAVRQSLPLLKASGQRLGVEGLMRFLETSAPFEALAQEDTLAWLRAQIGLTRDQMQAMQQFEPVVVAAPLHVFWAVSEDEAAQAGGPERPDWLVATAQPALSTQHLIVADHYSILDARRAVRVAEVLRGGGALLATRLPPPASTIADIQDDPLEIERSP